MNSSITDRLLALSLATSDPIKRAGLDAERAYHMSRIGDFKAARDILRSIRADPVSSKSPTASVWIILAEGVVDFFENLSEGSHDRFLRAHALSTAIGNYDLRVLSAAWLAHAELEKRNYQSMVFAANDCLSSFPNGSSSAHSRIFLVLANANLYCGNLGISRTFYERARNIAVQDGDRATLGAISHNQAVLMLNSFRLGRICSLGEELVFASVSLAVESAANFQEITKNLALGDLISISLARLAACAEKYKDAIDQYEKLQLSSATYRAGTKSGVLTIEYAHCLASSGQLDRARDTMSGFDIKLVDRLDNDDKVIALAQLKEIYLLLGSPLSPTEIENSMNNAKSEYLQDIMILRDALQKLQFVADFSS